MSNRNQLIKLIHVAKRELGLDDDTYRLLLEAESGKASCSKLNIKELERVLGAMESKGFKRQTKGRKTPFKKRLSPKSGRVKTYTNKITAIWITMAKQGFVHDGSAMALDAYVRRMTHRNKGEGVDHVAWCKPWQAQVVLESLKSWHRRVMIDAMKERNIDIPTNHQTETYATYDVIAQAYTDMKQITQ